MTQSKVHISLDTLTIVCSAKEIADTFAWLLEEMRAATPRLRPDERTLLRRIMASDNKALTVGDLFPDFRREHEAHKTLRRLRAAQFIRPAKTGRWEANEPIEVKPFGRLLWDHIGEAGIFGDEPGRGEKLDEEEIDLSLPEVDDPQEAETIRVQEKATWNDDDVLDFLKESKKA